MNNQRAYSDTLNDGMPLPLIKCLLLSDYVTGYT